MDTHGSAGEPPATTLEVRGHERVGDPCFTRDALREIDAVLREGPFKAINWEIADQQGVHSGADLDAILKNVFWPSVRYFKVYCARDFPVRVPNSFLYLSTQINTVVNWGSASENRQPVELTFLRVVDLLRRLPASPSDRPAFVDSLPVPPLPIETSAKELTKAWWNPLRAPRSILDWILISLLGGVALAAIVAVAALLAQAF